MPASPPYQQEHTNHASGSSEQHATSAVPSVQSTSSILPPPRQPITFNGHTYEHLPAHLAAMLSTIPSISAPRQRRGRPPATTIVAPTPVCSNYLLLFVLNLTYN
jgi:hypothetical protein